MLCVLPFLYFPYYSFQAITYVTSDIKLFVFWWEVSSATVKGGWVLVIPKDDFYEQDLVIAFFSVTVTYRPLCIHEEINK